MSDRGDLARDQGDQTSDQRSGVLLGAVELLRQEIRGVSIQTIADGAVAARLGASKLEAVTQVLTRAGVRPADLFAAPSEAGVTLRVIYADDRGGSYLVTETDVAGTEYPELSVLAPSLFVEECEVFEQFGLLPSGSRSLNRVLMAPRGEADVPLVTGERSVAPREVRAPHFVRGEAIEFPFGPVRAVGWESLYMGLVSTGEEILDLYLFYWHKHRGVERRLRGLTPERALFFVERIEGLSAVANTIAYSRAVEAATGATVPAAAALTRAVALELERIYNHAAAIAALCQATGLSVGQANAEIVLEELLRLNLDAFGHRYLFDVVAVGGVRRAPDRAAVRARLATVCTDLRRVIEALLSTNSFVDRLEACGIVTVDDGLRLGLVGPVTRGCGVEVDCRLDHPWAPFDVVAPTVPVGERGDALARMEVFVVEIEESERLIEGLIDDAGDGVTALAVGGGEGLGWAESSRGESLAWVALDADGRIGWARVRPASVRNWRAFDDAARAQNVFTDIPIIEASFWLTVAGFAR
jgi:Ni,Fe-hydrogenase III large subunit